MTTASCAARSSVGRDVDAHVDAVLEAHALGLELLQPPLDDPLLDLEVRHAEADQPAAGLVALVDRDRVPRAAQLLRGGQARRAGADHGDRAAGLDRRRLRHDPALVPRAVDDRDLDLLDRDRVALADLQHARRLARRGAQLAGELREVVGRVQLDDRLAPAVAVDEVVPVRDQVARAGSRCGRTARRTPCSARPARAGPRPGSVSTNSLKSVRALARVALGRARRARSRGSRRACPSERSAPSSTNPSPPVRLRRPRSRARPLLELGSARL